MPKVKSGSRQRDHIKKQLKRLQSLGLTGTRKIDLRKKPSRSTTNLIKRWADVLDHKAAVVKIPKSEKKKFRGIFPVVGDTIIVPRSKGEKNIRFDPKAGEVVSTAVSARGKKFKQVIYRDLDRLKAPKGERQRYYSVAFKRGTKKKPRFDYQTFDNLNEMKTFMAEYGKSGRYADWARFVKVYDVENLDDLYDKLKNPDEVYFDGENLDDL